MRRFEDHFSKLSREYALHRPQYPERLFEYLAATAVRRDLAWDCGTGNGQAALGLARHFTRVVATDASPDQIRLAAPHERIEYRAERAEDVSLAPGSVDLVTVAVAAHWFDLPAFYDAVRRVSAGGGIIALWTYHLPSIDPAVDRVVSRFYSEVLSGFWPGRFNYVDERYRTLPFPFEEITPPDFEMHAEWDMERLAGFLSSWSASRRYLEERGVHPVEVIRKELGDAWGDPGTVRPVRWPLHMRVGRVG